MWWVTPIQMLIFYFDLPIIVIKAETVHIRMRVASARFFAQSIIFTAARTPQKNWNNTMSHWLLLKVSIRFKSAIKRPIARKNWCFFTWRSGRCSFRCGHCCFLAFWTQYNLRVLSAKIMLAPVNPNRMFRKGANCQDWVVLQNSWPNDSDEEIRNICTVKIIICQISRHNVIVWFYNVWRCMLV